MQNTTILKKNKNMVTRKIADETILLPIYRTSKEINCIYTLNKSASIVWDMIDGKTTVGEIKDKVLNNGFDLVKDKGLRIKVKVEKEEEGRAKGKEGKAEREREEKEKLQSRDRACPVLKLQKQEVDSQLKVFFGELKEIKAVIRDTRSSILDTRKKKKNGKRTLDSDKRVSSIEKRPLKKGRKMKFRPEITRVKLNPEQAVLTCACYAAGGVYGWGTKVIWGGYADFDNHYSAITSRAGTWCHNSREEWGVENGSDIRPKPCWATDLESTSS